MGIKIWWPVLFIAVIICVCVLIFPSNLRLADLLGKAGRHQEAIEKYQSILRENPLSHDALLQLSQLYILTDQSEKAVEEVEKIGAKSITDVNILRQAANIYSQLSNKVKTREIWQRIVQLQPDVENKARLAEAYEWNRETDQALTINEELLETNPDDPKLLHKLVQLNLFQKNYKKSVNYLRQILAVETEDDVSRVLLGNVYIETDQKHLAALEYEKVLKNEPGNLPLREKLADLYFWIQNYDRGIPHYERLVMQRPLRDKYFNKLLDVTYNYDPTRAVRLFEYRLNYLPKRNDLRERFVQLHLDLGDTEAAVTQMNLLVKNNPDDPKYLLSLANLYQDTYQPKLAHATNELIFEKGFENQAVIDELVAYYESEKEYDRLLDLYAQLEAKHQIKGDMFEDYTELLVKTRNYKKAIESYNTLLAVTPDNVDYRIELAQLYQHQNQNQEAVKLVKSGRENYGLADEKYLTFSAEFFANQKLYDESIYSYQKLLVLVPENRYYKKRLIEQYIKVRDYSQAAALLNETLAQEPQNLELKLELASLYWQGQNSAQLIRIIDDIETKHWKNENFHKILGQFYFERGFFNETIDHLQTQLTTTPNDSASLRMLGLAYAWNNQPELSKRTLLTYHENFPNDFYTHYQMGEVLYGQGRKKEALKEFQVSLDQINQNSSDKQARVVSAKILAYQNVREASIEQFESLLSSYPNDVSIYNDYAESLLNLKEKDNAQNLIDAVLDKEPNNYRALRLRSRNYYERGEYKEAARTLVRLNQIYPEDLGVHMDLADNQLAAGNWVNSTETLEDILNKYPKNIPAQHRLASLRREQNEAFSTDFKYERQDKSLLKQVFQAAYSRAVSSLISLKLWFSQEKYSSETAGLEDATFKNLGLQLFTSGYSKLRTSLAGRATLNDNHWFISGSGTLRWFFNVSNSIAISSNINELWNDPFVASFFQARLNRFQSDLNLSFFNRIILWNRLSYEQHSINNNEQFGDAFRSNIQIGYQWRAKPQLYTYYQHYRLKYQYANQANRDLISIPENDVIHYLGATINQQLSGKFYYELGGNVGYNSNQENLLYYGLINLEYLLANRIRLRSRFLYGSQNRLTGNQQTTSVALDLFYFY